MKHILTTLHKYWRQQGQRKRGRDTAWRFWKWLDWTSVHDQSGGSFIRNLPSCIWNQVCDNMIHSFPVDAPGPNLSSTYAINIGHSCNVIQFKSQVTVGRNSRIIGQTNIHFLQLLLLTLIWKELSSRIHRSWDCKEVSHEHVKS